MSSLRRLAKDHATLRAAPPPNYVLPPDDEFEASADDLTQLPIYITGSEGTPYCHGLWLLHLRIPPDYPKSPPKATFRTRIFHPNVDEKTGAVCLETLKRDWDPKLTLKDILITISCLLIQPNPDSALNEKAGVLVREDFEGFIRQAKLMTKIHAAIPAKMKSAVEEARRRGEDDSEGSNKTQKTMHAIAQGKQATPRTASTQHGDDKSLRDSTKENKPSQRDHSKYVESSTVVKNILGKRPLAALTPQIGGEHVESGAEVSLPAHSVIQSKDDGERPRKSPKHTHTSQLNDSKLGTDKAINSTTSQSILEIHGTINLMSSKDSVQSNTHSTAVPSSKYRNFARVGIKRL